MMMKLSFFSLCLVLSSCSPRNFSSEGFSNLNTTQGDETTNQVLLWEGRVAEGKAWSAKVFQVIQTEEPALLTTAVADMATFCPRYGVLGRSQRTVFWGQLVAAISKFESNWNPTERLLEKGMGVDLVTQEPIANEGLMHLSYQDSKIWTRYLCDFDWLKDQVLNKVNPLDPRKSIFEPQRNLRCGVRILAKQILSRRNIVGPDAYWPVLKPGHVAEQIQKISIITRALPFCE